MAAKGSQNGICGWQGSLVFVGPPACIPVKSRMWRTSYMAKKVNDKSRF